ncbi:MAG: transposase [Opitutaceae bacterium]|nr:transposase [Opitutaceae bacterium]
MNESKLRTIEQIERFLAGNSEVEFSGYENDRERYAHLSRVLKRFDYPKRNKRERGVLLAYLRRTSGYSRAQLTRLVARWRINRKAAAPLVKRYSAPLAPFKRKYLAADIKLLVEMDKANDNVCGPATAHLLKRAYQTYGDERYQRLAGLSVSHLYNLRKSVGYQTQRTHFTKTHSPCNPIGVRRAPRPNGRAGFIRIDSVHQGDQDGVKGVYHITCVDEVSQWQVQSCVQGISEAFLLPVLALVMAQFPFEITGFHSDNGSEYINTKVAKLLGKLHIEQTKSRARHSNDNALAESKNGSVVRKHMGYSHIPQMYAEPINHFYQQCFNPWLNLHRPSMFSTEIVSPKGKIVKRYNNKDVKTPLECLVLLDKQALVSFKTSATLTALLIQSLQVTDLAAAQQMQHAKRVLFKGFANPKTGRRGSEQRPPTSISPRTAAGRLESAFNNRSI